MTILRAFSYLCSMRLEDQIKAMSNSEIVRELGRRFKDYRLSCRMTQEEAAQKAGIGLITLRNFENGKAYNITMTNFLALLRTVGQLEQVEEVLPEIPLSPYVLEEIENKKPKRIRHAK